MNISRLKKIANRLGISHAAIPLRQGVHHGTWVNPSNNKSVNPEKAALGKYMAEGWRGYAGEGGLILNLIKAMSIKKVAPRHRSVFVEAIYAQNVAFEEDRFSPEALLAALSQADRKQVASNYDMLASKKSYPIRNGILSGNCSSSMLDYFPELERWMFVELYALAGNKLLHSIAAKFMEDPYEYRRGWPDITMWKDDEIRFVEVKTPGDNMRTSQKIIINEFVKPLGLNYWLAEIQMA